MRIDWPIRTPLIWSIALGASFGLLLRITDTSAWFPQHQLMTALMSLSYLSLGSIAVGYITVWYAEINERRPVWQWIVVPWCSTLLVVAGAAVFLLEGAICLVFALPLLMIFASIGGVIAGLLRRRAHPGIRTHLCIVLLPFIMPQVEMCFNPPLQIRTVRSEIRINAEPSTVWRNIASVNPIQREELPDTWTARLGFPRPIAATLSHEGVGGVRNATFERGLRFVETVNVWEPNHRLSFGIKADTENIPPATLDIHAKIGGAYFDVLSGEYEIEDVGGAVILHLMSRERLTTDFNGYAGLWTDATMRSIQTSILQVIKGRCEAESRVNPR